MPRRSLTDDQVMTIYRRAHAGESNLDLAADYGTSPATVSQIKHGHIWRRVTGHTPHTPQTAHRNGRATMREADVLSIYRRVHGGESVTQLAHEYGITPQRVSKIKHGVDWAWLTGHRRSTKDAR